MGFTRTVPGARPAGGFAVQNRSRRFCRTGEFESTSLFANKKRAVMARLFDLAERVGFEPTKGYKPLLVFKTSAFNRSATSPES